MSKKKTADVQKEVTTAVPLTSLVTDAMVAMVGRCVASAVVAAGEKFSEEDLDFVGHLMRGEPIQMSYGSVHDRMLYDVTVAVTREFWPTTR